MCVVCVCGRMKCEANAHHEFVVCASFLTCITSHTHRFLPMHYRFCQELAEKGREKGLKSGTQTITVSSTYARQCQLEWNRARDKEAARQREADSRRAPTTSPPHQDSASSTSCILESHLKIEKVALSPARPIRPPVPPAARGVARRGWRWGGQDRGSWGRGVRTPGGYTGSA